MRRFRSPPTSGFLLSWAAALRACVAALAILFGGAARAAQDAAPVPPVHLVFLHTNDVHGQVLPRPATVVPKNPSSNGGESAAASAPSAKGTSGTGGDTPHATLGGLPRLAARIAVERAADPGALLVDGGDWYQGTPEGALDHGLPFVRALARLGYDAASLGNHDFDHGVANARLVVRESGMKAIVANLRDPSGKRPEWAAPWTSVEREGVRVALVGFLTPETPEITSPELRAWTFAEPADELERVRTELAGRSDLIVPVGHISVAEARALAQRDPWLPLIVSGHSHTYLPAGERVGTTLIVQTGSKASALGRVDLWLERGTLAPLRAEAKLLDLYADSSPEDAGTEVAAVRADCDALVARAANELAEVVGELAAPFSRAPVGGVSAPSAWLADVLRARAQAEVGVHNRGGTRCDLPAGPVTRRALFELFPFDNDVVSMDLTGAQLESLARRTVEGTRHLGLEFSGATLFVRRAADGARTLERLEVGGKPLERERRYRVATNSFLANGGDGAVELQAGTARRTDPAFLRDAAESEFRRLGRVTPPDDAERRVVEVKP